MLTFLFGAVCGWLFLAFGQLSLEKGYVREGIAKLYGKYYRITPINNDEFNNGGWSDDK